MNCLFPHHKTGGVCNGHTLPHTTHAPTWPAGDFPGAGYLPTLMPSLPQYRGQAEVYFGG